MAVHLPFGSGADGRDRGAVHLSEHLVHRALPAALRHRIRARTSRWSQSYSALARLDEVPSLAADVLEVARGSVVTAADVHAELDVIRAETAERRSDLRWRAQEHLLGAWWAGTSWEHSPLGDVAALRAADVARLAARHRRRYCDERAWVLTATQGPAGSGTTALDVAPEGAVAPVRGPGPRGERRGVERRWRDAGGTELAGVAFTLACPDDASCAAQEVTRRLVRAMLPLTARHGVLPGRSLWWIVAPSAAGRGPGLRARLDRALASVSVAIEDPVLVERARLEVVGQCEDPARVVAAFERAPGLPDGPSVLAVETTAVLRCVDDLRAALARCDD